jgi:hypothetical protein
MAARSTIALTWLSLAACGATGLPVADAEPTPGVPAAPANSAGRSAAMSGCGNRIVELGEQCEPGVLVDSTCRDLGFRGGFLRCGADCRYDSGDCTATAQCPMPDAPVSLSAACVDDLCVCDRLALLSCSWSCWSQVACRVATCVNNPSRSECADGCPGSGPAELRLGRCYQSSTACTSLQRQP